MRLWAARWFCAAFRSGCVVFAFGCAATIPTNEATVPSAATWGSSFNTVCAPQGPEVCLDGLDNNCNGAFEEGCGVAQGTIQFFVAWRRPEVDVDLVVVDPSGAAAELGAISKAGLLKERECPAKNETVCKVGAYENVVLVASREPMPGRYRVEVSAHPAPADAVTVVLAGRLGALLVSERFSLDLAVPERTFEWSLPGEL